MTSQERSLLDNLRKNAEGTIDIHQNGDRWSDIYLDNIDLRSSNPRLFAGLTGSLARRGLYQQGDGAWAMVKLET